MESFPQRRSGSPKFLAHEVLRQAMPSRELLRLPPHERSELMERSVADTFSVFRDSGAVEYKNIGEMYEAVRGEEILVRREDPAKVLELVADKESIAIDFPNGERYSNAVAWSSGLGPRGMQNAFYEGYGQLNGIVMVAGFRRGKNLDIQMLPDAQQRFAGLDRTYVRSIQGSVDPQDVLFVTLRIPSSAFPESEMTDRELEAHEQYKEQESQKDPRNPTFIYRGFLFTENLKKQ